MPPPLLIASFVPALVMTWDALIEVSDRSNERCVVFFNYLWAFFIKCNTRDCNICFWSMSVFDEERPNVLTKDEKFKYILVFEMQSCLLESFSMLLVLPVNEGSFGHPIT